MDIYLIVGAVVLIVFISLAIKVLQGAAPSAAPTGEQGYRSRGELLTAAEMNFVRVLALVLPDGVVWQAKVRIADILEPIQTKDPSARQKALNRITSKHVDLIICDAATTAILCAIELDDRSHARKDRSDRDLFVDRAFGSAGLPLHRFAARRAYAPEELREALKPSLGGTAAMAGHHR